MNLLKSELTLEGHPDEIEEVITEITKSFEFEKDESKWGVATVKINNIKLKCFINEIKIKRNAILDELTINILRGVSEDELK